LGGNLTDIDCQVAAGSPTVEVMPEVFSGTIELLLRLNGEVPMPCAVVSVADKPLARLNDDCFNRPHGQPPPRGRMNRNHFHGWKCRSGVVLEQNSVQCRRRKDTTSVPPERGSVAQRASPRGRDRLGLVDACKKPNAFMEANHRLQTTDRLRYGERAANPAPVAESSRWRSSCCPAAHTRLPASCGVVCDQAGLTFLRRCWSERAQGHRYVAVSAWAAGVAGHRPVRSAAGRRVSNVCYSHGADLVVRVVTPFCGSGTRLLLIATDDS
jgi:hypothetical protein